jgi:hypothetical protein
MVIQVRETFGTTGNHEHAESETEAEEKGGETCYRASISAMLDPSTSDLTSRG